MLNPMAFFGPNQPFETMAADFPQVGNRVSFTVNDMDFCFLNRILFNRFDLFCE